MVRRLHGPEGSLIANSPIQVGPQTCIGFWPSEKFEGIYTLVSWKSVSLLQVVEEDSPEILAKRRDFGAFTSYFSDITT
jgi:hypothetical protein